ncbi:MAG: glycolate oxidase iron-sulfur subunit [Neptuniibacter caesariensis]|uniref:Glycolate oxidase iron-sulfur subunit n=1 Tax=Neptuniibacter caesariensis TaxID=207954 RepID=A0A2G6JQU6_NEPCE|nr:MAG: glycolate oxidase iron-sulfur subunit [Neptuniibacter caesariensis]
MQTQIAEPFKESPMGAEAEAILRKCVHCGFCLATCPTYKLTGDELDSPRGRIYLLKQLLEGNSVSAKTQFHLDRCLGCRACETTCPASVPYHRLVELSIPLVEAEVPRSLKQRLLRRAILSVLPYHQRFSPILNTARLVRPLLPKQLAKKIPPRQATHSQSEALPESATRSMLILEGCVQPSLSPEINQATARVLGRLGIKLEAAPKAGCCGAVSYHLNQQEDGLDFMRRNIDAWWPQIERGCEAIVITASGCGTTVKEYGELLKDDPAYAEKAKRVSALAADLIEILSAEDLSALDIHPEQSLAFQCPCSLQHGQKLGGKVEALLRQLGFEMKPVRDSHICCGSAGTYSIFQPELATELRANKLQSLHDSGAQQYISANIGCIMHLSQETERPVRHWIQIIDQALHSGPQGHKNKKRDSL